MKINLLNEDYIRLHGEAEDCYQAIHLAAEPLVRDGKVRDTFMDAVCTREIEFPTGLDTPIGVAVPHTEAFHVLEESMVLLTLKNPVPFHLMGDIQSTTPVSIIFLLAIKDGRKQLLTLQNIVSAIQDHALLEKILGAKDAKTVYNLMNSKEL